MPRSVHIGSFPTKVVRRRKPNPLMPPCHFSAGLQEPVDGVIIIIREKTELCLSVSEFWTVGADGVGHSLYV